MRQFSDVKRGLKNRRGVKPGLKGGGILPLLCLILLALLLAAPLSALADDDVEGEMPETDDFGNTPLEYNYPHITPPTGARMIQQNAYTPSESERALRTEDLAGAVTYVSEAVIRLTHESDDLLSLDYKNVDVRALIARIAKLAGRHVLFFGETSKVSVKCNVVTPMKALDETLKAAEGMKYLLDDDVIVVGPDEMLTNTFLYSDVVTTRRLSVMTVDMLRNLCEMLSLTYVSMEAVEGGVRLVATPHNLAHVLMLLESLDAEENFINLSTTPELILEPLNLQYITGKQLAALTEKFGIRSGLYYDVNDEHKAYLTGPTGTITDLRAIVSAFDVPLNAAVTSTSTNVQAQPYKLTTVAPQEMERMLENCGIAFNILSMSDGRSTVYAIGDEGETGQIMAMMRKLDQEGMVLTVLDSATTTKAMTTLRDAIVKATSLKTADFAVTNNLGSEGDLYYLYCVSTAEKAAELRPYNKIS